MNKFILPAALGVGFLSAGAAYAQTDGPTVYGFQIEGLERRSGDENEQLNAWSTDAFIGNDEFTFHWLSAGEYDERTDKFEGLENSFIGEVPLSDSLDVSAGVRFDTPYGKSKHRTYAVLGLSGLAKEWFELDASLAYSNKGNLSGELEAEYELSITNELVLTPSAGLSFAFSDDTEIETKSGFTGAELGLQLSYDLIDGLVTPYIGGVYERKLGGTASFLKEDGEDTEAWFLTTGIKVTF